MANHPAQEHVEPFAGRAALRRGHVFAGALGRPGMVEEVAVEANERIFHGVVAGLQVAGEGVFQRSMFSVEILKKLQKIQGVGGLEGTVFKIQKTFPVGFGVVKYKIEGRAVHKSDQPFGALDDGFALPPGQDSRPETHDLAVLQKTESMRDADGVIGDKIGCVVPADGGIEKIAEGGGGVHTEAKVTAPALHSTRLQYCVR